MKARWGLERRHAYRLIDASAVKADLCPMGYKNPKIDEIKTERQLRELVSVPTESLAEVIAKASEIAGDGLLTANVLKEAREQVLEPEKLESPTEPTGATEPTAQEPACADIEPEPEPVGPLQCVGWFKSRSG